MVKYWILSRINFNGDEVFYNPKYKYYDFCYIWGAYWYTTKRSAQRASKRQNDYWQVEEVNVESAL